jgi:hypothetical protein
LVLTWSHEKKIHPGFSNSTNKSEEQNFETAKKQSKHLKQDILFRNCLSVQTKRMGKKVDRLNITLPVRYKLSKTANPAATPPSSDEETFVRIK